MDLGLLFVETPRAHQRGLLFPVLISLGFKIGRPFYLSPQKHVNIIFADFKTRTEH